MHQPVSLARAPVEDDLRSLGLLGNHPCMLELYDAIERTARIEDPVVVWGPTGSGKELVARAIHRLSAARHGPFCAVNVAALPATLVESEIFGTVRGAFTGALEGRPGLAEAAHRGLFFLDEAGDLPLPVQPKLLRLLDQGEVRRVGGTKTVLVSFRLAVAVQENPSDLRRSGRWREDLYYRVTSIVLRIPALKERRSDIPEIAIAFMLSKKLPGITPAGLGLLQEHDWPGNVRELQRSLVRAAFFADGHPIGPEHVRRAMAGGARLTSTDGAGTLAAARLRHVEEVVATCSGNTRRAAEILGISRRHLYRLLEGVRSRREIPRS